MLDITVPALGFETKTLTVEVLGTSEVGVKINSDWFEPRMIAFAVLLSVKFWLFNCHW